MVDRVEHLRRCGFAVLLALVACDASGRKHPERDTSDATSSSREDATREANAGATAVGGDCPPGEAGSERAEQCNGRDDDCDGDVDEAEGAEMCSVPNASAMCRDGACVLTGCRSRYRDCDGSLENGCEVPPGDVFNCGACGRRCEFANAIAACDGTRCEVAGCAPGFADCDGDGLSCEAALDSASHCGECGHACPALPHARSHCAEGACGPVVCDPGYADCNGNPADGCEQALDTLDHCGSCGARCAKASCSGGVCSDTDCGGALGKADCDRDGLSCETDLRTEVQNCGSCGAACEFSTKNPHARAVCAESVCRTRCGTGYGDCDGLFANGCETPLSTLVNCGECGQSCRLPNATATCSGLECRVQACNVDFADCDGDAANGCETRLDSVDACGGCSLRCEFPNGIATCAGPTGARTCFLSACQDGFEDCDGDAANGCERNTRDAGDGACLPRPNCVHAARGGHDYYICPEALTWVEARLNCQLLGRGDLAVIETSSELEFLGPRVRARHWIGFTDLEIEGLWIFARSGVPFWRGGWLLDILDTTFELWGFGEPDGSGDCAAVSASGRLEDLNCNARYPFICEVAPDACPDDPNKLDPGQCGCGVPDTDSDADGFADCVERK